MGQLSSKLRAVEGGRFMYWCQGCEEPHMVGPGWQFDGNVERPTFSPSVLVTCGHYAPGWTADGGCWCTYNAALVAKGEEASDFKCERCHTFIRGGIVDFLGDCTHALAGQRLELPDLPDHMRDGPA
jgi:hypothetical protein